MYKVFFNEHQLVWDVEINNSSKDNIVKVIEIKSITDFLSLLVQLEKNKHVVKLIIVSKQSSNLMQMLKDNLSEIHAAGGLVTNDQGQFLFIKRFGKWDLPKGKIEKNETPEVAALREVEEECGINGLAIKRKLLSTFHLYRSPYIRKENNWVIKETHWFEMSYSGNAKLKPQFEEGIEEARWFSHNELTEPYNNTYGNLQDLLDFYLG